MSSFNMGKTGLTDNDVERLKARCENAGIEIEINGENDYTEAYVHFANNRSVVVTESEHVDALLNFDFENYDFLKGLAAVVSCENKTIEALVYCAIGNYSLENVRTKLGIDNCDGLDGGEPTLIRTEKDGSVIKIGSPKYTAAFGLSALGKTNHLAIIVTNAQITSDTDVKEYLKRSTEWLFFYLDRQRGVPLRLVKSELGFFGRIGPIVLRIMKPLIPVENVYPNGCLNVEIESLYMYARSASGSPLMQYLAYYQILEFYLPRYASAGIVQRSNETIENFNFPFEYEEDAKALHKELKKIINCSATEKERLRWVLKSCVKKDDWRGFFSNRGITKQYFQKENEVSDITFNPDNKFPNVLDRVSDRIYGIRCRIVHTKNPEFSGKESPIWPDSFVASELASDLKLIELIAVSVIEESARIS